MVFAPLVLASAALLLNLHAPGRASVRRTPAIAGTATSSDVASIDILSEIDVAGGKLCAPVH